MKLPKISYDPISKLIDLLVDAGIDKIKEKADRNARVIAIRNQLNLGADKPLADDFDGVYAFTLAKYYEGDYPKAILEFFGDSIIKETFRKSFEQRNFGILEDETENFLDWNILGKQFQELDIQPQAHFEGFQQLFYEAIELTKLPKDIVQDQKYEDLDNRVSSLEDDYEEIKEGKEQVLSPPFTLPPIDISKFTGREKELKDLEDLIFNQEGSRVVGIVGLTGTGGMGKSALAVRFAHKYKDRFPDGIIGIRVDKGTADEIARNFALQVVTKVDPELKANQIMQRYFQNRQALLILDNVEDATARELEPGGDRCAVIITTRNRNLNLGTTGQIDLNRFSLKETHDLLVSLLNENRVDAEPNAVERIHNLVGGLPLAIRIVGGALDEEKETTLEEFADRLENEKSRLYLQDPDDESLDVHASINVSLKKLDETQIYLYSCLSVCAPEGFSSETIKAVSQRETDIVKKNLARLVKLSLLDFSEENKRYLLHPLLFDAATELAKSKNKEIISSDISAELISRHIDYFRGYAQNFKGLKPGNLVAIEREIDELLLVFKRLIESGKADYAYYLSLEPFFQSRGYWRQAIEIINSYLAIAREYQDWVSVTQLHIQQAQFFVIAGKLPQAEEALQAAKQELVNVTTGRQLDHLESMVLNSLGGVLQRQGKFDEAVNAFQRSYEISERLEDDRSLAMVLNSLGGVLQRQGKFDEAVNAFQRSYEISERLEDDRSLAMVLNSLGGVLQRQGKFDEAVDAFQRSYELLVKLGDDRGQAMVLNSLGGVLQRQGKFDEAVDAFQRSYEISERLEDDRSLAMVLNSLGGALQRLGKFDEAVDAFQRSYELLVKLGDDRGQAMVLNSLGGVLQRQGKFDEAVDAFQRSAKLEEKLENLRGQAMVLNSLGGVLQRKGDFSKAVDAFKKCALIEEQIGNERGQAMVLNSLGGVLQRQGNFDTAVSTIEKSLEILVKLGDERGQAMVLNSLGGVYQRQGKFDESVRALQQSAKIEERLKNDHGQAMVLNSLGGVLQRQGKFDDSIDAFQRSYELLVKLGDDRGQAMVLNSLGGVLQRQGKFDDAVDKFKQAQAISERLNNEVTLAMVLNSLGGVLQRQGKFDDAVTAFQRSFELLVKLNDEVGQAMVHFGIGKMYIEQTKYEDAKAPLIASFEINEKLKIEQGMRIVTPSLTRVLSALGNHNEAEEYTQRALAVVPNDKRLLRLSEQLAENRDVSSVGKEVSGHIKKIIRNLAGYLYGFIIPDDGGDDIYFGEDQVDEELIPILAEGLSVWVEVEMAARGPRARRVWLKEE